MIFDDTIANNISLWSGDSHDPQFRARIVEAARRAFCDEFIQATEKGYDTPTGERGVKLSGGQKQRLAIAKELFKRPEILILDEATSALDSDSERAIQRSVDELKGQMTIIVIAHRLSTIRNVDRIFVLKDGAVVEEGSFAELLARPDSRFRQTLRIAKPHLSRAMSASDLTRLCRDRPLITPELHSPSDFYGHAAVLKRYAGFAPHRSTQAAIEHAVFVPDFYWDVDLRSEMPLFLCGTEAHAAEFLRRSSGPRRAVAIGPMIGYVELPPPEGEPYVLAISRALDPSHSRWIRRGGFAERLKTLRASHGRVKVCVYWKDVLTGLDRTFSGDGLRVRLGRTHVRPQFLLPRLARLMASASLIYTNEIGSHVLYAALLNRPAVIEEQPIDYVDDLQQATDTSAHPQVVRASSRCSPSCATTSATNSGGSSRSSPAAPTASRRCRYATFWSRPTRNIRSAPPCAAAPSTCSSAVFSSSKGYALFSDFDCKHATFRLKECDVSASSRPLPSAVVARRAPGAHSSGAGANRAAPAWDRLGLCRA